MSFQHRPRNAPSSPTREDLHHRIYLKIQEHKKTQADLKQSKEEVSVLEAKLKKANDEKEEWRNKAWEQRMEASSAAEQKRALEFENFKVTTTANKLTEGAATTEKLTKELDELKKMNKGLKRKIDEVNGKYEEAHDNYKRVRKQRDDARQERDLANKELLGLKEEAKAQAEQATDGASEEYATSLPAVPSRSGTMDVLFAHLNDNELPTFFIMTKDDSAKWDEIYSDLQGAFDVAEPITEPKVNDVCCAMFDELAYRARITNVKEDTDEVDIVFVDYGNTATKKISEIKKLPKKFADLHPLAIQAFLDGVDSKKASKATDNFREMVEMTEDLKADFKSYDATNNQYIVDLTTDGDIATALGIKESGGDGATVDEQNAKEDEVASRPEGETGGEDQEVALAADEGVGDNKTVTEAAVNNDQDIGKFETAMQEQPAEETGKDQSENDNEALNVHVHKIGDRHLEEEIDDDETKKEEGDTKRREDKSTEGVVKEAEEEGEEGGEK